MEQLIGIFLGFALGVIVLLLSAASVGGLAAACMALMKAAGLF